MCYRTGMLFANNIVDHSLETHKNNLDNNLTSR